MLKQALVVVLLVALVFLLRREDEDSVYFKAADFASKFGGLPEDFESETPDLGDDQYLLKYPLEPIFLPSLPSGAPKLFGSDSNLRLMGDFSPHSSKPVLVVLHGVGGPMKGARLHFLYHFVQQYGAAVALPQNPKNQWFWPQSKETRRRDHLRGFNRSLKQIVKVLEWIRTLKRPIVVVGHSQGGVIGFEASLNRANETVLVSGYFVKTKMGVGTILPSAVHFLHDRNDRAVPFDWGRLCFETLDKIGGRVVTFTESHRNHEFISDETETVLKSIIAKY